MQIHLHQTQHTVADFQEIFTYLKRSLGQTEEKGKLSPGLHVFPELFLTGYPLQDLCLQRSFINRYQDFLKELQEWVHYLPSQEETLLLMGGLDYEFDEDGLPLHIKNVVFAGQPGEFLTPIYTKCLLPNYDIFDEEKYFTPGRTSTILNFQGKTLGILICEDMWTSTLHPMDPVEDLQKKVLEEGGKVDLIVNLSASPFNLRMPHRRKERAREIANSFQAPFCYVNRVGGEDEILFDGTSFLLSPHQDETFLQAASFRPEIISKDISKILDTYQKDKLDMDYQGKKENTWESLFKPDLISPTSEKDLPHLPELSDRDCQLLTQAMGFGIQEYAKKCGFQKFLVALSGGLDSALVLTLVRLSLKKGQSVEAVFMPSLYSSQESYDLSFQLCQNLGVPIKSLPIKFFHSSIRNAFQDVFQDPLEGLADENIQSRLRGALIYARSNQTGAMVLNTSNKSEIAVGYSTQYGDSVGAISVLGDLYKSEVFQLAQYLNQQNEGLIPEKIISRPPTAELRENQKDEDSLPPYPRLDAILEGFLSYRLGARELRDWGFAEEEIQQVFKLYQVSEFKRAQFAPILKLKAKSFGFGYRVPICKRQEIS